MLLIRPSEHAAPRRPARPTPARLEPAQRVVAAAICCALAAAAIGPAALRAAKHACTRCRRRRGPAAPARRVPAARSGQPPDTSARCAGCAARPVPIAHRADGAAAAPRGAAAGTGCQGQAAFAMRSARARLGPDRVPKSTQPPSATPAASSTAGSSGGGVSRTPSADLRPAAQAQAFIVKCACFENQEHSFLKGWCVTPRWGRARAGSRAPPASLMPPWARRGVPPTYPAWTDADIEIAARKTDYALPAGWSWSGDWRLDTKDDNSEGWEYASSWTDRYRPPARPLAAVAAA